MNERPDTIERLTVVSAANCNSSLYLPAEHVAFVFPPEAGGFVLDMTADVHALDANATEALKKTFAGDGGASPAAPRMIEKLVELKLLRTPDQAKCAPAPDVIARALAILATGLLRHSRGATAVRLALALARLGLKRNGWAATFAAWTQRLTPRSRPLGVDAIDATVSRASAGDLTGADCKERALCAWALARQSGLDARITIGVALYPLSGHCWCSSGGRVLGDTPGRIARYAPALVYA
jgi:Transglutaminase-like superfamily